MASAVAAVAAATTVTTAPGRQARTGGATERQRRQRGRRRQRWRPAACHLVPHLLRLGPTFSEVQCLLSLSLAGQRVPALDVRQDGRPPMGHRLHPGLSWPGLTV